ncbi:MAG: transcriptional repressor [Pseudomonadota bacterium]
MSDFSPHDHGQCVETGLSAAEAHCAKVRARLTPVRRRTLEILLREHKAMGAYEVLAHLDKDGLGSAPPVAYRALDFLVTHGLVHKVEKLNAYVACAHPGEQHDPAFMICRSCDAVAEATSDPQAGHLGKAAQDAGFEIERTIVEAEGICPSCQAE